MTTGVLLYGSVLLDELAEFCGNSALLKELVELCEDSSLLEELSELCNDSALLEELIGFFEIEGEEDNTAFCELAV